MLRHLLKTFMVMSLIAAGLQVESSSVFGKENQNEMIMQKVRMHIEQNTSYDPEALRIEFLSELQKTPHLPEKSAYRIESRSHEEYIGDTSFNVRLLANNKLVKEESIRVRIEVLRDFVVSQKSIVPGQIISMDDVAVQKKWVRRIPLNSMSDTEEVIGKTIVANIRPNTLINRNMLREVMPVKKGKMVQVVLDNGVMRMLMNGVAEEDGAEDSLVKVRNLSSNKIFHARVIGPSKVQIDF